VDQSELVSLYGLSSLVVQLLVTTEIGNHSVVNP
jgi:hypothetical protein